MEEYSREELLNRLNILVNESDFISPGVITTWENLNNIEDLKKLLALVFDTLEDEKKMTKAEKDNLLESIIETNDKQISEYEKEWKIAREKAEKKENEEEKFDETLLNF